MKEVDEKMELKIVGSISTPGEAKEIEEITENLMVKIRINDICNFNNNDNKPTETDLYNFGNKPKLSHF